MRELIDSERKSIAALYSSIGANIPRHLLPDISYNPSRRYEVEKELIPTCGVQEYEAAIKRIDSTEQEKRGAEFLKRDAS